MPTDDSTPAFDTLAFIGFGEAGAAFASGLSRDHPIRLLAHDIKTDNNAGAGQQRRRDKLRDYARAGVHGHETTAECVADAGLILSLVTADQAVAAAQNAAQGIAQNSYYLDCNSCAPDTKRRAASIIGAAGGRYVDAAIMAPVHPDLHRTPMLLSGEWAETVLPGLTRLGLRASLTPGGVGAAASVKLIRSVMVKGLEALTAECVLAGTKAGVADTVLDTLAQSYPGFDWHQRAAYMLERMVQHGERRAAEMREAAQCVDQLGLSNAMALATSDWQQRIGELDLQTSEKTHQALAGAILAALNHHEKSEK